MAHMDVVPVENTSLWSQNPWNGDIADGFIWGRGTMDNKMCVMSILESVEYLLKKQHRPKRTICLAFGHDEETGGHNGTYYIAQKLLERNYYFEFILDEGTMILDGIVPGVSQPIAMVGTSEKGFIEYELIIWKEGGHSSMPPVHTAIGILSDAVTKLEENPMPYKITGSFKDFFKFVSPELDIFYRIILSNLWLFDKILPYALARKKTLRAAIQTTTAVTMISGGTKSNVLPNMAKATVNHRILPGETVQDVIEHTKTVINNPLIEINVLDKLEASPYTRDDTQAFYTLQYTIHQMFPDVLVSPGLMIGNTDTRHYWKLTDSIFRFSPFRASPTDLERLHGIDERISVDNYVDSVNFYYQLLQNADKLLK